MAQAEMTGRSVETWREERNVFTLPPSVRKPSKLLTGVKETDAALLGRESTHTRTHTREYTPQSTQNGPAHEWRTTFTQNYTQPNAWFSTRPTGPAWVFGTACSLFLSRFLPGTHSAPSTHTHTGRNDLQVLPTLYFNRLLFYARHTGGLSPTLSRSPTRSSYPYVYHLCVWCV